MAMTRGGSNEINVTPLIDVLLVLLVIFLIVMPSITTYEEVHTPSDDAGATEHAALIVRVKPDLSVVLVDEGREIALEAGEVPAGLRAHLRETTHVVYIELDEEVQWGHVISTVDTIKGIVPDTQVALMTDDPEPSR
jgi:biopolymer transport protein ExbD